MPLVQEQQVELAQRRAGYALAAAERVAQRGDEHEVLVVEREFGDSGDAEGHREQQQVEAAGGQAVEQAGGLLLVHLEVEVGVALVDEAEDRGQQIGRDRRDDAQPQRPGERRPHRLGLLQERADLRQHRLGPYGQPLTGGREQHLARRTLDERHAEDLLQGGDGTGERRLAHADRGGGVPEVQMLRDGGERAELGQARLPAPAGLRSGHARDPCHGHASHPWSLIDDTDQHDRV